MRGLANMLLDVPWAGTRGFLLLCPIPRSIYMPWTYFGFPCGQSTWDSFSYAQFPAHLHAMDIFRVSPWARARRSLLLCPIQIACRGHGSGFPVGRAHGILAPIPSFQFKLRVADIFQVSPWAGSGFYEGIKKTSVLRLQA